MKLDIFIEGELIDLCVPTREYALTSEWYSYFNNAGTTRYLPQGLFPNNPEDQLNFYDDQRSKRLLLIVSDKKTNLGVISFSNICLIKKQATMAMVLDKKKSPRLLPYIAMEAIARIVEHGIETMGLNRINSGQHIDLKGWQNRKELLGFRFEGIKRDGFIKGREVADVMLSSLIYDDFKKLVEVRGEYWDSYEKMRQRMSILNKKNKQGKETFLQMYNKLIEEESNKYYDDIFSL